VGFAISTTSLPVLTRGKAYGPVALTVVGVGASSAGYTTKIKWGEGPPTTSGTPLPKGLTLTTSGVVSGKVGRKFVAGTYQVSVEATEKVILVTNGQVTNTKTKVTAVIPLEIS
jgi:hypothetical protein